MKAVAIVLLFFTCIVAGAQNRITRYEYWFNANYQGRQQINIVPAAQVNFQGSFSTAGLSDGLNLLHLHFGDDSSRYSATLSQFFIRRTPSSIATGRINAYQYWFDNNLSGNVLQTVTPSAIFNLNGAFDVTGLSNGLHFFNIRFRDNINMWSHPVTQFFYKSASVPGAAANEITAFQYWFDSDFQLAVTEQVSPQSVLSFSSAIATNTLSPGIHILKVRFRDVNGHWSAAISQFVYVNPSSGSSDSNLLTKMQYWFDDNVMNPVTMSVDAQALVQIGEILNARTLSDGLHKLNMRFADTTGHWSGTITQFFFKTEGGNVTNNVITGYRYWFNNDQQDKMVVHSTPAQSVVTVNTNIDMGCLTAGSNRIHLQFQDRAGLWSSGTTDTLTVFLPPSNIYRFTGNGNWSNAANWQNNNKPALDLPDCKEIIIDHAAGGACVLDVPQNLLKNAKLTVLPGKHLVIPEVLRIK